MPNNLKFRAWDLKLNKFVYFDFSSCLPIYGNSEEFVVNQWTGIFDRKTKPIYSGDIIDNSNTGQLCEIGYFDDIYASFGYRGVECKGDFYHLHTYKAGKDFEVIGNIYENPELLK